MEITNCFPSRIKHLDVCRRYNISFLCCATTDTHTVRNIFEFRLHKADQQVPCKKPASVCAYSLLNNLSSCWELKKNHQGFDCTPWCQLQTPIPRWRNNPGTPDPLQGVCNPGKNGFDSILDCQFCILMASRGNLTLIWNKWKIAFLANFFLCAHYLAGTRTILRKGGEN